METNYLYSEDNTELRQYIIKTDSKTECYNIWEHYFTKDSFVSEIEGVGFNTINIYDDIVGKAFSNSGETLCGIFSK